MVRFKVVYQHGAILATTYLFYEELDDIDQKLYIYKIRHVIYESIDRQIFTNPHFINSNHEQ